MCLQSIRKSTKWQKPLLSFLILLFIVPNGWGQAGQSSDTADLREDLNLLKAPSSVGFALLDIESSTVPRPQSPTELAITVLNETNDLGELPQDFAMEFSPYWVFGGESADYKKLLRGKVSLKSIWQSFQLSVATKTDADTVLVATDSVLISSSTSLGLGFNVTILAGKPTQELIEAHENLKNSLAILKVIMDADLDSLKEVDSSYQELKTSLEGVLTELGPLESEQEVLVDSVRLRTLGLADAEAAMTAIKETLTLGSKVSSPELLAQKRLVEASAISRARTELALTNIEAKVLGRQMQRDVFLSRLAEWESSIKSSIMMNLKDALESQRQLVVNLPAGRIGWRLDLAAGLVVDIPQRQFDSSAVSRYGGWLTGGYDWDGISWLGVVRVLGDKSSGEKTSWDIGTRLIGDLNPKLSASLEAAYRHLNFFDKENEETWRIAFRTDYIIGKNKSVVVTFGRDFEGKTSGNLISALQLVFGFGSSRPI